MRDKELVALHNTPDSGNLSPPDQYIADSFSPEFPISLFVFWGALLLIALAFVLHVVSKSSGKPTSLRSMANLVITTVTSFVSSVVISAFTLALIFIFPLLDNLTNLGFEIGWILFSAVIFIGIYATLGLVPSIYIGAKKGIGWGALTLAQTISWLVLFLFGGMLFTSAIGGSV